MNALSKNVTWFLFFLLFLWGIATFITIDTWPAIYQDDAVWSHGAKNYVERSSTVWDFYLYAKHLLPVQIGVLFSVPVGLSQQIFGTNVFGARLPSFLFIWMAVFVFYHLCRGIFENKNQALLVTLLVATSYGFVLQGHKARPEAMLTFWFLSCLFLLYRLRELSMWKLCGLGFLAGLVIEINLTYFFPMVFVLNGLLWIRFRSFKALFYFNSSLPLVALGWLIERYFQYGGWNYIFTFLEASQKFGFTNVGLVYRFQEFTRMFDEWLQHGIARWPEFLLVCLAVPAALWAILQWRWKKHPVGIYFGATYLLGVLSLFIQGRFNDNYLLIVLPMAYGLFIWGVSNVVPTKISVFVFWIAGIGLLTMNFAISGKKMFVTRHSMSSAEEVGRLIREHVPSSEKLLCIEGFYFLNTDRRLVGVRDLSWALKDMKCSQYLERYGIHYIVDTEYFDILPDHIPQDIRDTLSREFEIIYQKAFPSEMGNTFLKRVDDGGRFDLIIYRRKHWRP